ncbi:hypothetical protein Leryth_016063 [Lithospermum erythrorhizon]|nr:hypothetical protein Leryth_016063 [Lithospermum erythrorhizon]
MDEVTRIRLSELLQALTISTPNNQENNREDLLKQLVQKGMSHFEEYVEQRAQLAQKDALAYFATSWCSALEMTLLWLGGCRPSYLCPTRLRYVWPSIGVATSPASPRKWSQFR